MPDARISELPLATFPADADLAPLVQANGSGGNETRRASVAQLRGALLADRGAHVRDYGAKGDGAADDAPAIQAAIDNLKTRGGGTLLFGPRTYRIASPVVVDGATVRLQGAGFTEGPSPAQGTWLLIDTPGFTPIKFTGLLARGSAVRDIAVLNAAAALVVAGAAADLGEGVDRADAGRPVFAVLGLHHAREWPSGEMPMEFATDLARGYAANPRIRSLLQRVRVLVLPMINPDGFVVSRSANGGVTGPQDENSNATLAQIINDQGAYKRKNCRPTVNDAEVPCANRSNSGVDLNRNYGAYWGGVGSSSDPTTQGYRGTGPFSEPESEAFHRVSQTRAITTVISHHTFTAEGTWLRQPGFCQTPPNGCQSPYPEDQRRDPITMQPRPVPPRPESGAAAGPAPAAGGRSSSRRAWRPCSGCSSRTAGRPPRGSRPGIP